MSQFSANLGFLWTELTLADAIVAAKHAGFSAVECHWPYKHSIEDVNKALLDTSLSMLSLNTSRGTDRNGENGLCAIPGKETEARLLIDEAIDYALSTRTQYVHVMPGTAQGVEAHKQFIANLQYAIDKTKSTPLKLLIEPLNTKDAPGYFLSSTMQAEAIIKELASDKVKLMFDCYHVQLMQGNLSGYFVYHQAHIGHIQFAGVPDRGPPNQGEVHYANLFSFMKARGYKNPFGAEYKPLGPSSESLAWLDDYND